MIAYKINLNKLKLNYKIFSEYGPVYFPVKTNHNPIVLEQLKSLGSGFEVDSVEHIKKVYSKKLASKIMFSNVAKSETDILWAIKHNISYFTVDDEDTLKKIIDYSIKYKLKNIKFNIRLNVYECFKDVFDKKRIVDSRLGARCIVAQKLIDILNKEKRINIEKGFSFYIQAEVHNDDDCLIRMLEHIIKNFKKDVNVSFINIGGGANQKRLQYSMPIINNALKHFDAKYVVLEPGRYLIGDAEEVNVSSIRVVNNLKLLNEVLVSLEIGIYHGLIDISLHKRKFDIFINSKGDQIKLEPASNDESKLVLRGPTADSLDIIGIYKLPKCEINNNTIFTIKNVGAYVEVLNSEFSGKMKLNFITE